MDSTRNTVPLTLLAVTVAALHLLAPLFPITWRWGYDYHFFAPKFFIPFSLLFLLLPFLPIYQKLAAWVGGILLRPWKQGPAYRQRLLLVLLALLCFFILRETRFWGDAEEVVKELEGPGVNMASTLFWREPLPNLVNYLFFHLGKPLFNWDGELYYALLSSLCGGAFLLVASRLFRENRRFPFNFSFAMLLCAGTTLLFFGHIEKYALPYVFLLLSCHAAESFFSNRGSAWQWGIALAMLGACHALYGIFYGAAIIIVLAYRPRDIFGIILPGIILFLLLLATTNAFGIAPLAWRGPGIAGDPNPVMPLAKIVSGQHLLELFNLYMLLVPVPFLGIMLLLPTTLKNFPREPIKRFYLLQALIAVIVSLAIWPKDLMYKDWDFLAFIAIPAIFAFLTITGPQIPKYHRRLLSLLALGHFLSWLGYNWT